MQVTLHTLSLRKNGSVLFLGDIFILFWAGLRKKVYFLFIKLLQNKLSDLQYFKLISYKLPLTAQDYTEQQDRLPRMKNTFVVLQLFVFMLLEKPMFRLVYTGISAH